MQFSALRCLYLSRCLVDNNVVRAFVAGTKLIPTHPREIDGGEVAEEVKTNRIGSSSSSVFSRPDHTDETFSTPDSPLYEWMSPEQLEMCRMAYSFAQKGTTQQVTRLAEI